MALTKRTKPGSWEKPHLLNNRHYTILFLTSPKYSLGLWLLDKDKLRKRIIDFRLAFNEALKHLQIWPVAAYAWSRDCDLVESGHYCIFKTYWHLEKAREEQRRYAEGPSSLRQVSWKEYRKHKNERHYRDRISEAYDNGRGTRTIL